MSTGIAGAADHAPCRGLVCHVCHSAMESPHAMRGMPGVGVVAACSRVCAGADGFRTPMERAAANQVAALDELVAQAQELDMGYCLPSRTPHITDHADRPLPPPAAEA